MSLPPDLGMIQYDPHRWRDHLFSIKGSMVLEILGRVSACVGFSIVVVLLDRHWRPLAIPPLAHTLVGFAIGLLLVLRTNASYERYWEGRKQWGSLNNESRNLARGVSVLFKDDPALQAETVAWIAAFPYAMMNRLRKEPGRLPATLGLPADEVAAAEASGHVALAVAATITRKLNQARMLGLISDFLFAPLDAGVRRVVDTLGACERIHSTPLPYVYVVHLRRTLIIYCFTLPFALLQTYGWATTLVTLFVAYLFFGIEEIGVEIEDPFGVDANDLDVDLYCQRMAADVTAMAEPPRFARGDGKVTMADDLRG